MKKTIAVLLALFAVLSAAAALGETGMTVYPAGDYRVGRVIKPGEYVLLPTGSAAGFFRLTKDVAGEQVVATGVFKSNSLLTVNQGEYLKLSGCQAISAAEFYPAHRLDTSVPGVMLKVGRDIGAGSYRIVAEADVLANYEIFEDSRHGEPLENRLFREEVEVAVQDGQYLKLSACRLGELTATPVPTATPEPTPAPTPSPTPAKTAADPVQRETPRGNAETPKPSGAANTEAPHGLALVGRIKIQAGRNPAVRSAASTRGEKIGAARAEAEYEVLEITENWYRILLEDGQIGWVNSGMADLVKTYDPPRYIPIP